jgi:putative ABC transport system ATP-binding protein
VENTNAGSLLNTTKAINTVPTLDPLLRVSSVCRNYEGGALCALTDVSFAVRRGEYLAIMGPSGSGKSTLLNLLGALDRPTSGEIHIDGARLTAHKDLDRFRAQTLGFVFQSFHLLPTLTAIENVQIPMFEGDRCRRERVCKAEELLSLVGMSHRRKHLPAKLSVGERQRVAIARALANDPLLLLADEPTGNLDSQSGAGVLDLFDRLHREHGLTLLVITHGADVAARAQRILWIRDGRLEASPALVGPVPPVLVPPRCVA